MNIPAKYQDPEYDLRTGVSAEFGDDVWRVYADRDSIPVYGSKYLSGIVDTVNFLESFVVWEETENAVRIVAGTGEGALFEGKYFGTGAREIGWVHKRNLVLWPKALKKQGLFMKALITTSIDPVLSSSLKPARSVVIEEDKYKLYNILKIDGQELLLINTDILHDGLSREQVFWVNSGDVEIITERSAMLPNWHRLSEGKKIPVYSSRSEAEDYAAEPLFSIDKVDPYKAFMKPDDHNIMAVSAYHPHEGGMEKVYLNNVYHDFQEAVLLDYNEFLMYKELIELFSSYSYFDPKDLDIAIARFFREYGLKSEELEFMSVGHMMELLTGVKLPQYHADKESIRQVENISINYRNYLIEEFSKPSVIMENDAEIGQYRFVSDIFYYWMPVSWIVPDALYALSLKEKEVPPPPARDYEVYEVYYIDGSSVSNMQAGVFEKVYERLRSDLDNALTMAETDSTHGIYAYMSDGINIVKNDHKKSMESTVEEILLNIRSGTYLPNRRKDKRYLESELLFNQLEQVKDKLVFHFYISERFLVNDIGERCYMLAQLPERIYSIAMPKAGSQVEINLHIYGIFNERHINETLDEMKAIFFPESAYAFEVKFYKYN
jgi:hypothetical protein